ncbi:MAG TPA: cellulase family glycosylhydrolase [Pirellulales bacterium]|jgi:endoglucanase
MQPIEHGGFRKSYFVFKHFLLTFVAAVTAWHSVAATGKAQILYTGVNLSGAEFGATPTPGHTGTVGTDYTYPTDQEIDYFLSEGMNTIRLPFRWERLQPTPDAPFNSAEFARLNSVVQYATSHGATVILDPHNYGRYYPDPNNSQGSAQGLIGSAVPDSEFDDLWSRLAADYKNNSHVAFGLMNEPNSMPTEQWVTAANSAIAAIRSTGASNMVLVPGNAWTGASSWDQNWYGTPNATAMLNIKDPGNNFAIEVHQYLDSDGSGTSSTIANNDPNIGVERLTDFTQWLEANHLRGFLGEFAAANSTMGAGQIGNQAINNMLNYMQANSSAWLGWTWWAAGPWWGNYSFTLEPKDLGAANQSDQPAMSVLAPHAVGVHADGDVNMDGIVNAEDLALVASNWLHSGAGLAVDANRDGIVNGQDIALISSQFLQTGSGFQSSSAALSVPEPEALSLIVMAGILGSWLVRYRFARRTYPLPSVSRTGYRSNV